MNRHVPLRLPFADRQMMRQLLYGPPGRQPLNLRTRSGQTTAHMDAMFGFTEHDLNRVRKKILVAMATRPK